MAEKKKTAKAATETTKKVGRPRKQAEPAEVQPEILETAQAEIPEGKEYTVNVKTVLNVRAGAGKEFKVVRQIPNETTVTVLNEVGGWGMIGPHEWVMMNLLK